MSIKIRKEPEISNFVKKASGRARELNASMREEVATITTGIVCELNRIVDSIGIRTEIVVDLDNIDDIVIKTVDRRVLELCESRLKSIYGLQAKLGISSRRCGPNETTRSSIIKFNFTQDEVDYYNAKVNESISFVERSI